MLPAFFGSDGSFPLQFAIIFVVIFAVLAVLVLLIRRFTGRGPGSAAKSGSLPRQPRLGIVDVYELDRQRQLILLRRDNVEHLLLVGGPNDVVVERNIGRGPAARFADDAVPAESPVDAAPDFPPPTREPAFPLREPTFPPREASPSVRETKVPEIIAERRAIDDPSMMEPPAAMPFVVPPSFDPQPPAPPLRADRTDETVAVPVAARREPLPARLLRRTPPPLVNMKPDVASERSRASESSSGGTPAPPVVTTAEPDFEAAFAAALAEPVPSPMPVPMSVPKPAPAATRAPEPSKIGKVDAGILTDMARQLEEALRRPSPAVTPPPSTVAAIPAVDLAQDVAPAEPPPAAEPAVEPAADPPLLPPPSAPEPVDVELVDVEFAEVPADPREPEPSTDPMAAAMASAADTPPDGDGLFEESPPAAEPEPPAAPETGPELEPQPAPPPSVPSPSKPQSPPAGTNPFSVEEIEAEFARLLGRPLDRKN